MDLFKLGQITSPVGIKGEVRVYPYTNAPSDFGLVKELYVEGEREHRTVEKFRVDKNMVVLKLSGINDRNAAETFRNKYLILPKEEMYDMPEDTYYVDELIGMEVFDDNGTLVGTVESVNQNSSQDIYVIKRGDKSFMLPAVKEFVLNVDTENRKMTVHLLEGLVDL